MNDLQTKGSPEAADELWSLANGPGSVIDFYYGCICNGIQFHTRNRENHCMCQNSGLVAEGVIMGTKLILRLLMQNMEIEILAWGYSGFVPM